MKRKQSMLEWPTCCGWRQWGREQREGRGRASWSSCCDHSRLSAGSSCVCEGKLGFRLVLELGLSGSCVCHVLYHAALEAGRPRCESHDEHLDDAAGLSPDNRHREREERTHEARTLSQRTRRCPRVWVSFTESKPFPFILTGRIKPYFWNSVLTFIAKAFQSNLRILCRWVIYHHLPKGMKVAQHLGSSQWSWWYIIILTFSCFVDNF